MKLTVQPFNIHLKSKTGFQQRRVTIVTKTDEYTGKNIDRWCVVEAYPKRLKLYLYNRVVKAVGRCRLLW